MPKSYGEGFLKKSKLRASFILMIGMLTKVFFQKKGIFIKNRKKTLTI
jgi:hypothetical protein